MKRTERTSASGHANGMEPAESAHESGSRLASSYFACIIGVGLGVALRALANVAALHLPSNTCYEYSVAGIALAIAYVAAAPLLATPLARRPLPKFAMLLICGVASGSFIQSYRDTHFCAPP